MKTELRETLANIYNKEAFTENENKSIEKIKDTVLALQKEGKLPTFTELLDAMNYEFSLGVVVEASIACFLKDEKTWGFVDANENQAFLLNHYQSKIDSLKMNLKIYSELLQGKDDGTLAALQADIDTWSKVVALF